MDFDIQKIGQHPKFLGIRVSAWIEIFLFFAVLILLALLLEKRDFFFSVSPHPFWIIVILISAQYGINEGLLAAFISTVVLFLGKWPEREFIQDKFDYFFLIIKNPVLWFIAAVIVGEIRNRHIRERDRLREIALLASEKEKTISKAYESLKKIKERLEFHVASEMQTTLTVFEGFKQLEKLGKEEIIRGAKDLTRTLLSPEKFSIFILESDQLKIIGFEGWRPEDHFATSFDKMSSIFEEIIGNHRVISVLNADDRLKLGPEGVLAVPIIYEDKIYGMIKIEEISFIQLRITTIESLRLIGEWVGTAYASAIEKETAEEKQFIREKSQLLTYSFLQYQKQFLINLGKRLNISITIIEIELLDLPKFSPNEKIEIVRTFTRVIHSKLRSVDQAFEYGKCGGKFAVILLNTPVENGEIVRKKIATALEEALGKEIRFGYTILSLYEKQQQ